MDDPEHQAWACGVREKLLLLSRLTRGAYGVGDPMTLGDVALLETALGGRLPAEYRAFLLHAGRSAHGDGCELVPPKILLPEVVTSDDGRAEPVAHRIPLRDAGCGWFAFLVASGEHAGSVWEDATASGEGIVRSRQTFSHW